MIRAYKPSTKPSLKPKRPNLYMDAARAVMEVVDGGRALDNVLAAHAEVAQPHRHALFQEICYGGCRRYHYFDGILALLLKKPLKAHDRVVHFVLINACYQLEHMRAPDHAVLSGNVEALRDGRFNWATKIVNGVLRAFLNQRDELKRKLTPEAARLAHPQWLYDEFRAHWPAHFAEILQAGNAKPPLTLRVNRLKISRDEYLDMLAQADVAAQPTAHSALGITLEAPMPLARLPGFAEGLASVQDESAQLTLAALAPQPGERVLDGCAAPGGKTGLLVESQPKLAALVAVDFPARMTALAQNLARLDFHGEREVGVEIEAVAADLTAPQTWWDGGLFHRIMLDVPCSGSGVIRRHPDIKHHRRREDIARYAQRQLNLLIAAWALLAPGGALLYVTCSILPAENDGVIAPFLAAEAGAQIEPLAETLGLATKFGRQRLPGVHAGDGFYYCRLNKAE